MNTNGELTGKDVLPTSIESVVSIQAATSSGRDRVIDTANDTRDMSASSSVPAKPDIAVESALFEGNGEHITVCKIYTYI